MSTWIVAIDVGGEWQEHATGNTLDEAIETAEQAETEGHLLVGVFRNREHWQDYKPGYLIDRRDKSDWPIRELGGLINSLDSSWF